MIRFHKKSKNALLFLISFLFLCSGLFAEDPRPEKKIDENLIIIASDAHVMNGLIRRSKGYTADTTAHCRNFVQDVLAMDPRPCAVFMLGDNVELTTVESITKFREMIRPIAEAGIPLVMILGNHDVPRIYDTAWPELRKEYLNGGFYARRYNTPSADFLFLETTDRSGKDGYFSRITPEMRNWIDAELKKGGSKPVFLCGHHPVDFKKYDLSADQYPALQGWIHGHLHEWFQKRKTPIRSLAVPSLGFMDGGKRPLTGYVQMRIWPDHYTFTLITNDRSDDRNGTVFSWPIEPKRIDLGKLTSPILYPIPKEDRPSKYQTCFRDPAVWYENGLFYFFFTMIEVDEKGSPWSYLASTVSADLIHFEPVRKLTPKDLALNFGSPGNVVRFKDHYYLCVQTYCQENGEKYGNANSRIWTMRSKDLRRWEPPVLLRVKGDSVPQEAMGRMIDPYLIQDPKGLWYCFYKQNGCSLSVSNDLIHWKYVKSIECGENVCILYDEKTKEYRLWNSPPNGIAEMKSRDLIHWDPLPGLITLGQKEWDWAKGRLTAAVVLDLRNDPHIGKALLFFHASEKKEQEIFPQGTELGIAWSSDLIHWNWPNKK
ncbi:MAG: metallophosphoesterase [Planctomycetia bacterium]|nr:metallophosphoesterase [Planctomycetia bacterium]